MLYLIFTLHNLFQMIKTDYSAKREDISRGPLKSVLLQCLNSKLELNIKVIL